jgi:hypothetical protein
VRLGGWQYKNLPSLTFTPSIKSIVSCNYPAVLMLFSFFRFHFSFKVLKGVDSLVHSNGEAWSQIEGLSWTSKLPGACCGYVSGCDTCIVNIVVLQQWEKP